MKGDGRFYFKQFAVSHSKSALKVGVDGVLIGAWTDFTDATRILDIGTGCGLIALMAAQRNPKAVIDAFEIDRPSCEEARDNFMGSPWASRLKLFQLDFSNFDTKENGEITGNSRYNLIVSNPPFFDSGVSSLESPRLAARHQAGLPLPLLISKSAELLETRGRLSLILSSDCESKAISVASTVGLKLCRQCNVRGHEQAPYKRVMIEFVKESEEQLLPVISNLTLHDKDGNPTTDYRILCKDFYLKF